MKHSLRCTALLVALMCALGWTLAEPKMAAAEEKTEEAVEGKMLRVLVQGTVREMGEAEYLTGVLRAEMPASFEMEALKAQAVAARSYTLYKMQSGSIEAHPEADACDDVACCKAFTDAETAAKGWGEMAAQYEQKLARAVAETAGEVLTYNGESVLAVFFSSAAGRTQGAEEVWQSEVPYLQSVASPETEALVPNYYSTLTLTKEEFFSRIKAHYPQAKLTDGNCVTEITRNAAGYVSQVETLGLTLRGNELRTILGLRSPHFTLKEEGGELHFSVTGYGHGVGLSQYGANAMAKNNATYREILAHYYVGTEIETANSPKKGVR